MELIEDNHDHFTIKLDWKHDLNVIFAILASTGNSDQNLNQSNGQPNINKVNVLKKKFFQSNKLDVQKSVTRRKKHA